MTRKPEIQYVGQFYIHGSEAQVLAPKEEKKKAKTKLPLAYLERIEKVYVDPVALAGIAVAMFMLVVMVLGLLQLNQAWQDYDRMSNMLETLQTENVELEQQYRSGYDLTVVKAQALAIGMIPVSEAETLTVTVSVPEGAPVTTWWDDVVWFWNGLFA